MSYIAQNYKRLRNYFIEISGNDEPGNYGVLGGTYGYHQGLDRLKKTDYSLQTRRDKTAVTDAASAIDIKWGPTKLQRFSKKLVAACQDRAPLTRYIREIIYSPDALDVFRYDRARGVKSKPRKGESDDSHLWHTHISFYRDAELVNLVPLFEPILGVWHPKPEPPPEPDPEPEPVPEDPPTPEPPDELELAQMRIVDLEDILEDIGLVLARVDLSEEG